MQPEDLTKIESIFIRHRNCLLLRGQFIGIYTDYYLHLATQKIRYPLELDQMLKDSLAVLALHLTARPWNETIAWTANLRAPRINLFVTGSSNAASVTGRIFTEDVREPDRNFFYSQTTVRDDPEPRLSTIEVEGRDPVTWISQFYDQSEQRPGRAFRLPDENFALIAAQPDADLDWLASLTAGDVSVIDSVEETSPLETRGFRFHCGCDLEKILPILGGWREKPDELFADSDEINVQCPRCAATYLITRGMI